MKVIFVNRFFHPDISATSQMLTDLARHEASKGLEVHVVTSRQLYDAAGRVLPAQARLGNVVIHRVWTTGFRRAQIIGRILDYASFYASALFCLLRLAKHGDIIVAKTDPPMISIVVAGAAALKGAFAVNWLQDLFPEVATELGVPFVRSGLVSRPLRAIRDLSLNTARANVAIGDVMASRLSLRLRPAARVRVIHNWADGDHVTPIVASQNALRSEWQLVGKFVVGYSGNMGRAHEFETVLRACEALRDRHDIHFLFVGAGKQREVIEKRIVERRLGNVSLKPYQSAERLPETLSAADAHLITLQPRLEGLIVPSKFYGVAAAGRPAIFVGSRDGEIARIIRRDECGHVVDVGDVEGLTAAIRGLADSPRRAEAMGRRARASFDRFFAKRIAMSAWHDLLLSAVPHPPDR